MLLHLRSVSRCCSTVTTFVFFVCTLASCIPETMSSPDNKDYKVIVFDSYGTLIDVNDLFSTARNVINSTDPAIPTTLINLWRSQQLDYTWLRSLMKSPMTDTFKDFWTVTEAALNFSLAKLNISLTQSQQNVLMNGWHRLSLFSDVKASLINLKQTYELAVLSNGTPNMLSEVFKANGLDNLITAANSISVDEARVFKPHPAVYGLIEKKLGVSKSDVLFVSGNNWDVAGAKSFGLSSVWINRNCEPEQNLGACADMEFPDLNEFAKNFGSC